MIADWRLWDSRDIGLTGGAEVAWVISDTGKYARDVLSCVSGGATQVAIV